MKRWMILLGVVLMGGADYARGERGCCADCGCQQRLRKVCRWECEEIEVKVPCWDCECEDIVIPGKSPFCIKDDCEPCGNGCHDGSNCVSHLGGRHHHTKEWGPPCSCCVKTVNVLVRTEKTVKKKIYKPVIETVCESCCNACGADGCVNGSRAAAPIGAPAAPTLSPEGEAPFAPMPPQAPVPDRQTSRRGPNPLFSVFMPVSQKR